MPNEEQQVVTPPAATTPPVTEEKFPASWEEVFKHPRFKELNTRAQTAEQRIKEIETKEKEANDKALAEQNKWKELYENAQKDLSKEKVNNIRLKVASSKGLPVELVERLRGETEEELATDADGLLALMKIEPQSKGLAPARRTGSAASLDLLTETDPAKIREAYRQGNK